MKQALVLYGATDLGASEFSADILWATEFKVPDPVLFVQIEGRKVLFASPLEVERARKEANVDEVLLYSVIRGEQEKQEHQLVSYLKMEGVTHVTIPESLRYSLASLLSNHFEISAVRSPFGKERSVKREDELQEIEGAQRAVERAVAKGIQLVRESEIRGDELWHASYDHPLTSNDLRSCIDGDLYIKGYLGIDSIVACGAQAADPHCRGEGLLRPYQPIVLDIFPRSLTSLYFADQTRTVFKGEPSAMVKKMYMAVLDAQEQACMLIRDGAPTNDVMQCAVNILEKNSFPTSLTEGAVYGFIHGLGHGVGLEIHEAPSVGRSGEIFQEGMVVTVEPGLYYGKEIVAEIGTIPIGGIRIEDMVVVTKDGCRNLTQFPKSFEEMVL
ncbi:aminopeptidase P family protein [Candidatus Uhrbacteria bacterium]|nr:aminopeptidase P family protein [Candidatus Uhrbacteria bacterium]